MHSTVFHYQSLPKPTKAVAKTIALPDPGSVQNVNHVVAGRRRRPGRRRGRRAPGGGHRIGLGARSAGQRRPGPARLPAHDVQRAAGQRQGQRQRPPAGGDGAAGLLLRAADPDGGGHPRTRHRRRRRRLPRASTCTSSSATARTTHGRRPRRGRTSSTPSRCRCATPAAAPVADRLRLLPAPRPVRADGDADPARSPGSRTWPTRRRPGSITLQTQRTAFGIVIARARIQGQPVAYTNLRSTYMHELDSAAGFEKFNEPAQMRSPQDFFNAANKIGYTFNWFYTDNQHIAYFNSGPEPGARAAHRPAVPDLVAVRLEGPAPERADHAAEPDRAGHRRERPPARDRPGLPDELEQQAGARLRATAPPARSSPRSTARSCWTTTSPTTCNRDHHKLTLADLVNAMGIAGTQDLRGVEVLPYALKIIGTPSDPTLATAVSELRAWVASGAHRINREHPGRPRQLRPDRRGADHGRLVAAAGQGRVRARAGLRPARARSRASSRSTTSPATAPAAQHLGSSLDVGFYGIVQKDLRAVLHEHVARAAEPDLLRQRLAGPLPGGAGELAERGGRPRPRSRSTRPTASARPATRCARTRSSSGPSGRSPQPLIEWVNRPTFQQADEIQGHGPG